MSRIIYICLVFLTLVGFAAHANAAASNHTSAEQAILVDYDTGMVLFEKNADEKMPTSSMSKVMTMLLVFEALETGKLRLDTELLVSEKAWRKGGSKMFVEVDDRVPVEDLIRGVVVQSGNDATIVLAEGLAGSEKAFAEALNVRAQEIGMNNSHFMNASGWPHPEHYSTARDLAKLARYLITEYPDYYHYFSEKEYTYNNITQRNRNPLLYRDIGADGIKTGHTEDGGYGLMASGERNDRRVILVLNGLEDEKARAQESARMLEWGLKGFQNVTLFSAGEVVDYADVVMGKAEQVPLVIEEDLRVSVPITLRNDLKVEVIYQKPVLAPVYKGDQIGTLRIDIPRLKTIERPLIAGEDINNLGLLASTLAKAKLILDGGAAAQ